MRARGARLEEIEAVYRRRVHEFRGVAAAILRDREAAFDAVQDAFALAVRRRASFRGAGSLDAWLWRIVVRTALDAARRRPHEGLAVTPADTGNGHRPHAHDDVQQAIASLPERQRLALFLRYYADLGYREIADVLGVEVGTVSASLSAAHAAVRRRLEEVEA
jgi:RNA polymerase sigma-70 factor (ECF subfamily)